MSRSHASRPRGSGTDGTIFLLISASEPTPHTRSHPPVEVFTSEGVAREEFRRRRLEVGSGSAWAQLVAVEGQALRPLCWFGRPPGPVPPPTSRGRHKRRRPVMAALALSVLAVGLVLASVLDRAGAALAPYVSNTALVTVTASQRAEATAVNTSDACHRMEVSVIDGDSRTVASEASTVCPGKHLAVGYRPSSAVRLRSVVILQLVPLAIVRPASHSFEVQDIVTGRASVVIPAQSVPSR